MRHAQKTKKKIREQIINKRLGNRILRILKSSGTIP